MTTLANRATPRQAQVMRMIEGACRNAAHAHPGRVLDDIMARSIAKRATGTLTSQWGQVLAVPQVRSEGSGDDLLDRPAVGGSQLRTVSGRSIVSRGPTRPRGASHVGWRTPLQKLHKAISIKCGEAKRAGDDKRTAVFVEVLRTIGEAME